PPEGFAWRTVEKLRVVASSPQQLTLALDYDGGSGTLELTPSAPGNFALTLAATTERGDDPVAYLRVAAVVDENDAFYGLGEWPDGVEHRGKLRPMQIEADLTLESSNNENHVPVPLLIGTRGWGVFARSVYPGVFDVA